MVVQGREILQSTVDLVQNNLNLEVISSVCLKYSGVLLFMNYPNSFRILALSYCTSSILQVIYGDTDSIMIYSGLDDIANAKAMAGEVIEKVRFDYQLYEAPLDLYI